MPNHSRLLSSASYLGQEGFRTMTPLSLVVRGDRRVAESFSAARQCRLLVSLLTHKQSSGNAATVPFFGTSKTHRHSRCRLSNLSDLVPFMETKPRLLEDTVSKLSVISVLSLAAAVDWQLSWQTPAACWESTKQKSTNAWMHAKTQCSRYPADSRDTGAGAAGEPKSSSTLLSSNACQLATFCTHQS